MWVNFVLTRNSSAISGYDCKQSIRSFVRRTTKSQWAIALMEYFLGILVIKLISPNSFPDFNSNTGTSFSSSLSTSNSPF